MSYLSIQNLYKDQRIFNFNECYALEKIHGSSAHISWNNEKLNFFSGGAKYDSFITIFDTPKLEKLFQEYYSDHKVIVYGEVYGGKMQGMSHTYGKELKFIAFEVKIDDVWLDVPEAEEIVLNLGLEFVHWKKIETKVSLINEQRDMPSVQAIRNGCGIDKMREGIVLRPLHECCDNRGNRVIVKHKRDEFRETKNKRAVTEESLKQKLEIKYTANGIADEWVTEMRLQHILQKFPEVIGIEKTGDIIKAMVEDVIREAGEEIIDNKDVRKAIGFASANLYKKYLNNKLYNEHK